MPDPTPMPEPLPPPLDQVEADPKRPWKAYASTALSVVALFIYSWVADEDPFTAKEVASAAVAALVGGGVIGGVTYGVRNPKVLKRG